MNQNQNQNQSNRQYVIFGITIVFFLLVITPLIIYAKGIIPVDNSEENALQECTNDYNANAQEYNDLIETSSVDNVEGLPDGFIIYGSYEEADDKISISDKDEYVKECLTSLKSITNPSQTEVINKLKKVEGVTECKAVTKDNDPNKALGENGGYTSCVYFSIDGIDQELIDGDDIIAKGTDAGGCIEVYANKEDAQNRCEYLSSFDDTFVCSGSYAIIGTMVVRTSYQFTDEQQYSLTNAITKSFTEVA